MNEAGPTENIAASGTKMSATTSPSEQTQAPISPQEEALQSLCKQLLKSRLFRGFYLERHFVQAIDGYRDLISLHRTERQLEKLLLDITGRLELFYAQSNMWIGVTHGPLSGTIYPSGSLETLIWVELDELAFGQYWFSIKSLRFRQGEIILKLKMVREIEDEVNPYATPMRYRKSLDTDPVVKTTPLISSTSQKATLSHDPPTSSETVTTKQIEFEDFIEIVRHWGTSIKYSIYEFLKQDINKQNIKALIRFLALLLLSLLSGAVVFVKFLGIFTLHFMFEFSRLTQVMTPIILKIIDVLSKIVGGFYIILAMVWRDTIGKKFGNYQKPKTVHYNHLEYNLRVFEPIKFNDEIQTRSALKPIKASSNML